MARSAGRSYAGGESSLGYLLGDASPETQHIRTGSNTGNIYTPAQVQGLPIGELRKELRARGIAPGGGKEHLVECLNEAIAAELRAGPARSAPSYPEEEYYTDRMDQYQSPAAMDRASSRMHHDRESNSLFLGASPSNGNNYSRPEGQNVGNFLSDRNTSRVLAPPGGKSSFTLG